MVNRRTFVQAVGAGALLPGLPAFGALVGAGAATFYKVIYDRRFVAAEAFAAQLQRADVPLAAIDGDPTSIWFNDLHSHWQRSRTPIVGMTDYHSYIALELMAQAAGWRTAYLAHHDGAHRLYGPRAMLRSRVASALTSQPWSTQEWPQLAASVVLQFPADAPRDRARSSILARHDDSINRNALVSWVIAV